MLPSSYDEKGDTLAPAPDRFAHRGIFALVFSIIVSVVQVIAFVFYLGLDRGAYLLNADAFSPVYWTLIGIAAIASLVFSHRTPRRNRPVIFALILGYINLVCVFAPIVLTLLLFAAYLASS